MEGSVGKIFATMFQHFVIPIIWYATWTCSENFWFWPVDHYPGSEGGGRYVGKMFATMLLHFVIRFNLICNMPMFWKRWILTFWPHPLGYWRALKAKHLLPCCCILWFRLFDMQHDHVWKKWILTYGLFQRGRYEGLWAKCLLTCCYICDSL